MVKRLTEHPIRIGFSFSESGSNTFTNQVLPTPGVPSIALKSRGDATGIGLEIMKIRSSVQMPSVESAQNNKSQYQIVKGAAPTAMLTINNKLSIYRRDVENEGVSVTAVGEIIQGPYEQAVTEDLTDGDGSGELVLDDEIHVSVQGVGNGIALDVRGYVLAHLVEFETNELIFEFLEQASS